MSFFQNTLKNKRAIIYSRVSTEDQAERGYSLTVQENQLRSWCERHEVSIIQHFQDDGASAKTFDRPQFNVLLQFLKSNKNAVDYLLVIKWDRFSRNATDAHSMIYQFEKMGVEVNATEQWIDFSIPEQDYMLSFYLTHAHVENKIRSNRTTSGMRQAAKSGRWLAKPPKGYKLISDGIGKTKLVPSEDARFMQEAFQEVSEYRPVEEVRRKLSEKGFQCSVSQFHRLLRNPVYMGKVKVPAFKNELEEITDGQHEPLIPEELFFKAQNALKKLRKTRTRKHIEQEVFVLRGFLICSVCENFLTGSYSSNRLGQKYPYYHCQENGHKNRYASISANTAFLDFLCSLRVSPNIAKLYREIVWDIFKQDSKEKITGLNHLSKKIDDLEAKVLKIELKFANDEVDQVTYNRVKNVYASDLQTMKREKATLEVVETSWEKYLSFGLSLFSQLDLCYQKASFEVKRKMVCSIFGQKLIFDGKKYRTQEINPVIALLTKFKAGLEEGKKKESADFSALLSFGDPSDIITEHAEAFKRVFILSPIVTPLLNP